LLIECLFREIVFKETYHVNICSFFLLELRLFLGVAVPAVAAKRVPRGVAATEAAEPMLESTLT
jgi:hypothetical protein